MSNRKKRRKNAIIFGIIILIIIALFVYLLFFRKSDDTKVKALDEIEGYGYILQDRDTKLLKDNFNELKEVLKNDEVDYEKYASLLSKMFIIDLYTIDNKNDSYDIGGVQYVYPDDLAEYKNHVKNTLYKYIGYKENRTEKMPEVKSIEVIDVNEDTFIYNENEYEAYTLELTWEYSKDLGYDEKATVTVFKEDNKLFIGEFITSEDTNE